MYSFTVLQCEQVAVENIKFTYHHSLLVRAIRNELGLIPPRRTEGLTHFDVTNLITRGLTVGKTSKEDNVLMWN